MKTALKPDLKSKTLCIDKSYDPFEQKRISLIGFRFYQKIFIVLASLSIILIYSESPRELGNICESYNSKKMCIVW